ncbi:hypothetical protein ES703_59368 [subsurface metagenome]
MEKMKKNRTPELSLLSLFLIVLAQISIHSISQLRSRRYQGRRPELIATLVLRVQSQHAGIGKT